MLHGFDYLFNGSRDAVKIAKLSVTDMVLNHCTFGSIKSLVSSVHSVIPRHFLNF